MMHRDQGFSLVTIAALGTVTMLWLFAASASVIPMYQRASTSKYFTIVRSAAESGLDYTVAQLNESLAAGDISALDDSTTDGTPKMSEVPAEALGNNSATVLISVNNVEPPANSSVYDPQLDAPNNLSGIASNGWRIVTATANYAGLQRTIRVILQPVYKPPVTVVTQVPYFSFAMFAKSLVSMTGNATTDAYDSRLGLLQAVVNLDLFGADVGSNYMANISGNAQVGGDLKISSTPLASTTNVVATATDLAKVRDQLITNGITTGFSSTQGDYPNVATDNVLAGGAGLPRVGDRMSPMDSSQSFEPASIPPAKGVPSDALITTGTITWSGNDGYVAQPAANEVVDLGTLTIDGLKNVHLRPGMYKASSLTTSGNGQITIERSTSGEFGKATIFLEGNAPGTNVLQLTGNGMVNRSATPGQLQIWYNGSKSIILAGNGLMHSVVYAPNANVQIAGNGQIFGALVANNIFDTGNAGMHFDTALAADGQNWGLTYGITSVASSLSALKTISWQEL
jgi:hypothetical protein